MSFTGNALKATSVSGSTEATVAISPSVTELWVSFDLAIPQTMVDFVLANDYSDPMTTFRGVTRGDREGAVAIVKDGSTVAIGDWQFDLPLVPIAALDEHLVELHYQVGVSVEYYVDGTLVHTYSLTGETGTIDGFQVGLLQSTWDNTDESYWIDNLTVGTSRMGTQLFSDNFEGGAPTTGPYEAAPSGSPKLSVDAVAGIGLVDDTPESAGAGGVRVSIAFDDPTLEPEPAWTDVTAISESLVAGYEIDRGREDEFLSNDTGTARVTINDREGILDPTNAAGPYYTKLEPLRQILIELWNPVAEEWSDRFRGFIEDYDYVPAPWTHENQDGDHVGNMALEISCIDLRAIISAIEMQPDGSFGDTVPAQSLGNIFFEDGPANTRIEQVLGNAGIDTFWFTVFTLNVNVQETVYSPSQNAMEVVDDAAEADFPTVSVVYVDRHGVLAAHGRLAKFDPDGTAADAGPTAWDFHHWKAGDGTAVAASPSDTAHIRELAFNRGLGKIFNSAFCTPKDFDPDVDDPADQYFKDDPSIGIYGYRSWSAESLIVDSGILTGNTANEECLLFATFIVTNYKASKNRITRLVLKSMHKDDPRAAATWDLLANVDLEDMIDVTLSDPGVENTGGFNAEPFFIEGINETATPLNGEYAMVTTSLSVSPASYYSDPVGLDGA